MSHRAPKWRSGPYPILVLADVLAIFLVAGLSRGKVTHTVIGVLALSLPLLIVLWVVRVIPTKRRTVTVSANPVLSADLPVIRLGGAADRRFERRLGIVRRSARYFLLADVLAVVFVVNLGSGNVADAGTGILAVLFVFLVVLSLLRVDTSSVTREVIIDASSERVFALVADPQQWLRRGSWLGRYRNIDAEPAASGGFKGKGTLTAFGLPGHMQWEMLEYQPPHRVVTFARWNWLGIPSLALATWSLQPTDDGVRLHFEQESRSLGVSLNPFRPLAHRVAGQAVERRLAQLKDEAEQR